MRRKVFSLAIAALAAIGSQSAMAGDREIAEQIIQRLKSSRDSGQLKDFKLDMKVDDGVVLFRGSVALDAQRKLVLSAAKGIEGVSRVVDELKMRPAQPSTELPAKPADATEKLSESTAKKAPVAKPAFNFKEALAAKAKSIRPLPTAAAQAPAVKPAMSAEPVPSVVPGVVKPAAAVELAAPALPTAQEDDAMVVDNVVSALTAAKEQGLLRGFGVDVHCRDGNLSLSGRASSDAQRQQIVEIVESVPGVMNVRNSIAVHQQTPTQLAPTQLAPSQPAPSLPAPPMLQAPLTAKPVSTRTTTAQPAVAGPRAMPQVNTAPYRMQPTHQAMPVSTGGAVAGVPGAPVPMAPYSAAGAPRYDTPQLPNYAWPGYAAYPNYAALTYPQQYSPTAWPYIGPFYPYPQVPLGWRKVTLEWDDGWWYLDFTDRH